MTEKTNLTQKQKIGAGVILFILAVTIMILLSALSRPSEEEKTPPPSQEDETQTAVNKTDSAYQAITQSRTRAALTSERLITQPSDKKPTEVETRSESLIRAKEQRDVAEYNRAQLASTSGWGLPHAQETSTHEPQPSVVKQRPSEDREDLLSTDQQRLDLKRRLTQLSALKERIQSGQYSMGDGSQEVATLQSAFSAPPTEVIGYTDENAYNASTEGMLSLPIGTIIPAVTIMKANSDRLGTFKAVVSQDVMDVTQTYVLVPKGSELIIKSFRMSGANEVINSVVGMSVPWIVLPDGNKIDTSKSSGLDREGMGGISDQVDHHWMAQFLGVAAYALVANNSTYDGSGSNSDRSYELDMAQGVRDQLAPEAKKYLQLRPTNIIRSGQSMNIIIEDEIYLKPWRNIYEDYL